MPQGMYSYGETQDYTINFWPIRFTKYANINCNGANNGIIEVVPHATAPILEYSLKCSGLFKVLQFLQAYRRNWL